MNSVTQRLDSRPIVTRSLARLLWQVAHHTIGHSLVGLSLGRLWAWRVHDWTYTKGWPEDKEPLPQRWRGLE